MLIRHWIYATAISTVAAAALAEAQPTDPEAGEGSGTPPAAGSGSATAPARQVAHVSTRTTIHAGPGTDSEVVFLADPADDLVILETQGTWTHVQTRGGNGWLQTAKLGSGPADPYGPPADGKPKPPAKKDPPIAMPQILTAPTGWLLPAAVLYSRTGLDTGGGVTSDNRVGLGDVAEFGLSSTDQVRSRTDAMAQPKAIQPYVTATFRMGVAEHRLWESQPGLVLGFRKSFERHLDGFTSRLAELTFVASKHFGSRVALHVGGAFWDASLKGGMVDVALHDHDASMFTIGDQIRPFGGIQVEPIDKAEILVDVSWAPEFCYTCLGKDAIQLRPELAWGVRYSVGDFMQLESGVRVPDIGSANLLDAQIFGQVTFTTWALRHVVDSIK